MGQSHKSVEAPRFFKNNSALQESDQVSIIKPAVSRNGEHITRRPSLAPLNGPMLARTWQRLPAACWANSTDKRLISPSESCGASHSGLARNEFVRMTSA